MDHQSSSSEDYKSKLEDRRDPKIENHRDKQRKSEMEDNQKIRMKITDLPKIVLELIFSFLSFGDLMNVHEVCTSMHCVTTHLSVCTAKDCTTKDPSLCTAKDCTTKDPSVCIAMCCSTMDPLVWKHAPFDIKTDFSFKILAKVPYLHTVTGYIYHCNELLDSLMSNVLDLRKLDWHMNHSTPDYGRFSTEKLRAVIKKFKNLELIAIHNCFPPFVECVDIMLSTLSNLKTIRLYCGDDAKKFPYLCKVIGDGFSAVRNLEIICGRDKDSLSYIIKQKINQLTCLKFSYNDVYREVLELVFKSTRLKCLEICIDAFPEIPLDFSKMSCLKSLSLSIDQEFSQKANPQKQVLLDIYKNIKFPKNLEKFAINWPQYSKSKVVSVIMSNAINSAPDLRVLNFRCYCGLDLNGQLERINTLAHLHTVIFDTLTLSASSVEHILKCPELRRLEIYQVSFTDSIYESLISCKYLKDLKLNYCDINVEKLFSTILRMEYFTSLDFHWCKQKNKKRKLEPEVIVNMVHKLKQQSPHIKITGNYMQLY